DRVTLYRALDCLTDAGLAHKIAGDDRVFLYSASAEFAGNIDSLPRAQHQHGHFKCTRCAKVFCLDGSSDAGFLGDILAPVLQVENANTRTHPNNVSGAPSPDTLRHHLQEALQNSLGKGFQGHDIELTIKGWCADCAH
ncbi:MAG: transcriptional repressor, partial [Glaciimonas sp.]|nr:transcriptional repressor [Glaciimonas sp.]